MGAGFNSGTKLLLRRGGNARLTGALVRMYVPVRIAQQLSRLTEARPDALYNSDGFGGERTMRARVIRELIDEIRSLRAHIDQGAGARSRRSNEWE